MENSTICVAKEGREGDYRGRVGGLPEDPFTRFEKKNDRAKRGRTQLLARRFAPRSSLRSLFAHNDSIAISGRIS